MAGKIIDYLHGITIFLSVVLFVTFMFFDQTLSFTIAVMSSTLGVMIIIGDDDVDIN